MSNANKSQIQKMKNNKTLANIHPGEIILEEFLKPSGVSVEQLANVLDLQILNDIIEKKGRITVDIAFKLAEHYGTSVRFWLGLQEQYDIEDYLERNHCNIQAYYASQLLRE